MATPDVLAEVLHLVECEGPPQAGHEAQAVAIVAALAAAGLVVVSAEDLDLWANRSGHPSTTWEQMSEALARLRAALPERTETDA